MRTELEDFAQVWTEAPAFLRCEQIEVLKFKKYVEFSVASATQRWFSPSFDFLTRLLKPTCNDFKLESPF